MEDQDLHFVGGGVRVTPRILPGDDRGDGDVPPAFTREREYVRRLVLAAKTPVELLQAAIAGDQNADFTPNAGQFLRAAREAFQPRPAGTLHRCFEDDHVLEKQKWEGRIALPP